MLANDGARHEADVAIDWREMAERRLTRLTEAEHDLFVVRDRLGHLQSGHRLLLQQGEERLRRIHELERELEALRAINLQQNDIAASWQARLRPRVKRLILRTIGLILKVPLARPLIRRALRLFPRLGDKLRARLFAQH